MHRAVRALLMRGQALLSVLPLFWSAAAAEDPLQLESAVIVPNGVIALDQVFDRFGCGGRNVSPPLHWRGAPAGTQSFALTMFDPDAGGGAGFWHWLVYDIPPRAVELPQGVGSNTAPGREQLPSGAHQAPNGFGTPGYGGPCPPKGAAPHHYLFTLHALKVAKLEVPPKASAADNDRLIRREELAHASLVGVYGR